MRTEIIAPVSRTVTCRFLVLPLLAAVVLGLSSCGEGSDPKKIEHVVIIFQENRTPDNLFHDPVLIAHGADIASSGINSRGETIPLTPVPLGIDYDLSHTHAAFEDMYDRGKMDGADKIPIVCYGSPDCPRPNAQFLYVRASDVAPYFQLAEQYTFGDRMFQTNEGPSYPAHQFILSGTSAPSPTSKLFEAENPNSGFGPVGCTVPPMERVMMIDPAGRENTSLYPCFEHPTLTDELNAKDLSWRYYTPSPSSIWTAPNSIQHMCGPDIPPPHATKCVGSDWVNNVVFYTARNPAPILTDISQNRLPAVSWVIPSGRNSDHANSTANTGGPAWVAAIVNAIGNSAYWPTTAIIITWDDWGGWYDHVPPPQVVDDGYSWGSGYVYGFRVPLIVVSPYAKAGYISHVNHDFGSILNFVEQNFGLSQLGYADSHAADDLSDCFDLTQRPLQFQKVAAPLSPEYFLHDRRPPTDPDDD